MTGLLVLPFLGASVTLAAEVPEDSRSPIENVIGAFSSSDWTTVDEARIELESHPSEAVPALITLLGRDEHVPLQNTMALIYPGAKKFYGHGGIVDYDIDWLSVRAGWALEAITFESFGFKEQAIDESKLLAAVLEGHRDRPLDEVADLQCDSGLKTRLRSDAATRAKTWWQASSGGWTRFQGLLDALRSDDPVRQSFAIGWLRYGDTRCDGLNRDTYEQRVRPEIECLAESKDKGVSTQAKLLLEGKALRSYCRRCGYDLSHAYTLVQQQRRRATAKRNAAIRETQYVLAPEHLKELYESRPWRDIRPPRCAKCGEEAGPAP